MKSSFVTFAALLATSYLVSTEAVILEVPGYGVLNGTIENSSFTERLFYAFRSVFYAEKPTPENRFLVCFTFGWKFFLNVSQNQNKCELLTYSHRFQKPLTQRMNFSRQSLTT